MDEVNPNANYNSHLAKRYSIGHLIRRLRRHRLAAARSHFGSGIINAIHYRNAASLPLRGRLGNEILAGEESGAPTPNAKLHACGLPQVFQEPQAHFTRVAYFTNTQVFISLRRTAPPPSRCCLVTAFSPFLPTLLYIFTYFSHSLPCFPKTKVRRFFTLRTAFFIQF